MGANVSGPLRTPEVDWPAYIDGEWRSPRVRELDELGGLLRPAVKRGDSFAKKLEFLGTSVLGRATEIQNLFAEAKSAPPEVQEQVLRAAAKRLSVRDIVNGVGSAQGPNKARENPVAYNKPKRAFQKVLTRKVKGVDVAEWRIRMHAARRRTMLIIRVVALLRSGVKSQPRLSRVDSFSYMIPDILGEDCNKFVDQQLRSITARAEAEEACLAARTEAAARQAGPAAGRQAAAAAAVAAADADDGLPGSGPGARPHSDLSPMQQQYAKYGAARQPSDTGEPSQPLEPATPDPSPGPFNLRQRRAAAAVAGGSLLDQMMAEQGQELGQGQVPPSGPLARQNSAARRSCSGRLQYMLDCAEADGAGGSDEDTDAAELPPPRAGAAAAPRQLAAADMSLANAARSGAGAGAKAGQNKHFPVMAASNVRASYSGASSTPPGTGASNNLRNSYCGVPSGASTSAAGSGPVSAVAVGLSTGTAASRFAYTQLTAPSACSSSGGNGQPHDGAVPLMPTPPPMDNKQRRNYLLHGQPTSRPTSASVPEGQELPGSSATAPSRGFSGQPSADARPSTSNTPGAAAPQRPAGFSKVPDLHRNSWNGSTVFVPLDAPKLMAGGIVPVGSSVGFIKRPIRAPYAAPDPRPRALSVGRKQQARAATAAEGKGGGGRGKKGNPKQAGAGASASATTAHGLSLSDDLSSTVSMLAGPSAGRKLSPTGAAAAADGGKGLSPAPPGAPSLLSAHPPAVHSTSPTYYSQQRGDCAQSPSPAMHAGALAPPSLQTALASQSMPSSPSPRLPSSHPTSPSNRQSLQSSPNTRPSNLSSSNHPGGAGSPALLMRASASAAEGIHALAAAGGMAAGAAARNVSRLPLSPSEEEERGAFDLQPADSGFSVEEELWRVDQAIEEEAQEQAGGAGGSGQQYAQDEGASGSGQQYAQAEGARGSGQQYAQAGVSGGEGRYGQQQQWQQPRQQQEQEQQVPPQARQRAWQVQPAGRTPPQSHGHGGAPAPHRGGNAHAQAAAAAAPGGPSAVSNARRRLQSMDSYVVRAGPLAPDAASALELSRLQRMMVMFVNRSNCAWADAQRWSPPALSRPKEDLAFLKNYATSGVALDQIAHGRMAFWFLCGEDSLRPGSAPAAGGGGAAALAPPPSAPSQDLWTSDPYRLMYDCRRGLLHGRSCVKGFSLQSRVLAQLALGLADLAGQDAVDATHIVLSINEDQQEEVVKSLWDYKFYGFKRQNVVIISQPKRPGYRYHPEHRRFVSATNAQTVTPTETIGTGLAAMQLNWHPDAFVLSPEGLVQGLRDTTLELLSARGVKWMVNYRARDLAIMSKEALLDTRFLAQAMWLQSRDGAAIVTQAMVSDTMAAARALDSMLMCREGEHGRPCNIEMRMVELASRRMSEVVAAVQSGSNNKVAIGLQRYMFHVPSLKQMLTDNQHFRPKLRLRDDLLAVSLDIADVTSLPAAAMAVVQVDHEPPLLLSPKELDLLLPLVQQQDVDQRLLAFLKDLKPHVRIPRHNGLKIEVPLPRHTTAVFLDGSTSCMPAVLTALALARPNIDCVQLVMFVGEEAGIAYGQSVMARVLERVPRSSVKLGVDVVVRGGRSLMEAMQRFVTDWRVDLVVVPSTCLTRSSLQSGAILGSVALSILKRMDVPVLMVTARAAAAADVMFNRKKLRAMLLVEGWAMPLLDFLCDRVLVRGRADKLLLGQVIPKRISTRQQKAAYQCLMNDMRTLVEGRQVENVEEVTMDGIHYDAVEQAVDDHKVNLLAIHLPPGSKSLPKDLISMLGTLTSGVLIMKGAGFRPDHK